jgi:glycosyltransferase involved in cell wall biosynthesis
MRLLLTADPFLPVPPKNYGGIERIVAGLIRKLRARGHEVGLVAHSDSSVLVDHFQSWPYEKPSSPGAHGRNALCLRKAFRDFDPDLVHSFSRILYLSGLLSMKTPKVMSYQRSVARSAIRLAILAGRSLAFTGCSNFIATMGRAYGGQWHAIPNFIDTDVFKFSPSVESDAPLVFLSRIEPIKGAHLAVAVAKRTGRRLVIAGNHATTGAEGAYWQDVIKPQIGRDGIEYIGPVDDPTKIGVLKSAAALIVPIQWDEPFGIVFAEALACGTPVISCPRGALPEIVRQGLDGFLVQSVEEACRAVDSLAEIDRSECRRRAETCFSAQVVSRQYESLYESLLATA